MHFTIMANIVGQQATCCIRQASRGDQFCSVIQVLFNKCALFPNNRCLSPIPQLNIQKIRFYDNITQFFLKIFAVRLNILS